MKLDSIQALSKVNFTQRIKERRLYFKPEIKYDIGLHFK